jgi:hypothetical protein
MMPLTKTAGSYDCYGEQVDYRATIGGMTEKHAYIILPAEKVARLLEDRNVSILVEDLPFDLPFRYREAFREIGHKHGTR